jgi:hypothetical protein
VGGWVGGTAVVLAFGLRAASERHRALAQPRSIIMIQHLVDAAAAQEEQGIFDAALASVEEAGDEAERARRIEAESNAAETQRLNKRRTPSEEELRHPTKKKGGSFGLEAHVYTHEEYHDAVAASLEADVSEERARGVRNAEDEEREREAHDAEATAAEAEATVIRLERGRAAKEKQARKQAAKEEHARKREERTARRYEERHASGDVAPQEPGQFILSSDIENCVSICNMPETLHEWPHDVQDMSESPPRDDDGRTTFKLWHGAFRDSWKRRGERWLEGRKLQRQLTEKNSLTDPNAGYRRKGEKEISQQARPKDFGPDAEEQTMQLASQLIGGETDSSPVQGTEAEHLGKFRENARKNVLAIQLAAEARASCSVNEEEPLLPKAAAATDEQQPPEPIAHLDEAGVMPSKEWQRHMLKASPIDTDGLAVKHLPKPPQARPKKRSCSAIWSFIESGRFRKRGLFQ